MKTLSSTIFSNIVRQRMREIDRADTAHYLSLRANAGISAREYVRAEIELLPISHHFYLF